MTISRIKSLYIYLIESRLGEIDGWLTDYQSFTADVETVRKAINNNFRIEDDATYVGTAYAKNTSPWKSFADQLLRSRNGVTTTGQSILSHENFEKFIETPEFKEALTKLIKEPTIDNFKPFELLWERLCRDLGANKNPLLVNRTLAACTLGVSSTVNTSSFDRVYYWLVQEGFITSLDDGLDSWAEKNIQVIRFLHLLFSEELSTGKTTDHLLSIFIWELHEYLSNPFTLKKQIVKYGAPGTGKTYSAKRETRLIFDLWKHEFGSNSEFVYETCSQTVQFHPSYGYEDFMEGLRPLLDVNGKAQLSLQNGIFKRLCIEAGKWEIDAYNIPNFGPQLAQSWSSKTIADFVPYREILPTDHWSYIFEQSDHKKKIADAIPPFFLVIDEINRAELSRVLGELMLCLEYRGVGGAIATQYANINTPSTAMLSIGSSFKFFVPHNLFIVGTMNTIDRSVDSFDLALRRRFRWERMNPDIETLRFHLKQIDKQTGSAWASVADDLQRLNQSIADNELLGEDYQIGQAYLMNLRYPAHLSRTDLKDKLWSDSIEPLLEEYLRGSGRTRDVLIEFKKSFSIQ